MGENCIDTCHPVIMFETPTNFPVPQIVTILTYNGAKRPETDVEMNYLENKNIDENISQKIMNKDVYETYVYNI